MAARVRTADSIPISSFRAGTINVTGGDGEGSSGPEGATPRFGKPVRFSAKSTWRPQTTTRTHAIAATESHSNSGRAVMTAAAMHAMHTVRRQSIGTERLASNGLGRSLTGWYRPLSRGAPWYGACAAGRIAERAD